MRLAADGSIRYADRETNNTKVRQEVINGLFPSGVQLVRDRVVSKVKVMAAVEQIDLLRPLSSRK